MNGSTRFGINCSRATIVDPPQTGELHSCTSKDKDNFIEIHESYTYKHTYCVYLPIFLE